MNLHHVTILAPTILRWCQDFFGKFVQPGIINTNNTLKLFNLYNEPQMFLLKFFFH